MRIVISLLCLLLPVSGFGQDDVPPEVIRSANELSRVLSGGYEEETDRRYLKVQLTTQSPKQPSTGYVVFYTMVGHGGTSAYHHWMALLSTLPREAFANRPGITQDDEYYVNEYSMIGSRGWRSVDYSQARQNRNEIIVPYKLWKERDEVCCPSAGGTGRINFSFDRIVFVE